MRNALQFRKTIPRLEPRRQFELRRQLDEAREREKETCAESESSNY